MSTNAATRSDRRLFPGDPAPWFSAPTHNNPQYNFDTVAGRYVVLTFFGSGSSPAGLATRTFVEAHSTRFDDRNISFFGVTGDPADIAEARLVERIPGIRWFQDFDGAVARAYGATEDASPALAAQTLILDPALRVMMWISLANPGLHAATLALALSRLPTIESDSWSRGPAPVLVVPRVLEPTFCRTLVDYYEANGGKPSGHMTSRDGRSVGVLDRRNKRRSDCLIADDTLRQALQLRIGRRLIPQIARAFQFQATRIERYLVACYDGADRGFFFPHRDNTSPATRHRKFAVTINLNAEEYEGGNLRFPEFGRATYRAPTGGAAVFSCSLVHEALPVTNGRRYATLPFLYDDAAAEIRAATRGLIVPAEDQP